MILLLQRIILKNKFNLLKMKKIIRPIFNLVVKIGGKLKLRRFDFISNLNNNIRRKLKPEFIVTKYNHTIFLDKNDSLRLSIRGEWDVSEAKIMEDLIKEGDVVVDIGANIGYFTLILSKLVGERGHVYSFEPDPENFYLLKKNVEVNSIHNVTLINKAVSDITGDVEFYSNIDDTSMSSLYKLTKSHTSIKCKSIKLDDYFKDIKKKIGFIKIDVEGAEGFATNGARSFFEKNKDIKMITEIVPPLIEKSGFGHKNYIEMLKQLGFKLYKIDEKSKKLILMSSKELLKDKWRKNLLCMR